MGFGVMGFGLFMIPQWVTHLYITFMNDGRHASKEIQVEEQLSKAMNERDSILHLLPSGFSTVICLFSPRFPWEAC